MQPGTVDAPLFVQPHASAFFMFVDLIGSSRFQNLDQEQQLSWFSSSSTASS